MSPDDIEELLGAYALDALDDDERREVELYLAVNPRARAEVEQYREVASLLAFTGEPAPPGVWDRIAAEIDGSADADDNAADRTVLPFELPHPHEHRAPAAAPAPRRRVPTRGTWLVAAAAAVLVAVLGVSTARLSGKVDDLEQATGLEQRAEEALIDPDSRRVELTGAGSAEAAIAEDGIGYLVVHQLAALPEGRTYQLWGQSDGTMISLGLLGRDPGTAAFPAMGELTALAITDEPAAGVIEPSSDPVVSGAI